MNLNKFTLGEGMHGNKSNGTCLMEAISVITGESFTDHPMCVARPIADYGISLNDMATSTRMRNKYLRPLIPCLINTAKLDLIDGAVYDHERNEIIMYPMASQNSEHNRKVEQFLLKKNKEAYGRRYIIWPDQKLYVNGPVNPEFQKMWKTGVSILQEAAAYARELLGPSHDARECCTPEFLAMLKPAQEPVQTAVKTDA